MQIFSYFNLFCEINTRVRYLVNICFTYRNKKLWSQFQLENIEHWKRQVNNKIFIIHKKREMWVMFKFLLFELCTHLLKLQRIVFIYLCRWAKKTQGPLNMRLYMRLVAQRGRGDPQPSYYSTMGRYCSGVEYPESGSLHWSNVSPKRQNTNISVCTCVGQRSQMIADKLRSEAWLN